MDKCGTFLNKIKKHPFLLRLNDGRIGTPEDTFEQRKLTMYALDSLNAMIDLVAKTLKEDSGFAADVKKVRFRVLGE